LRPFFVTAQDASQTIDIIERLLASRSLDDVINLFRAEVARLDPEQADAVIESARQDMTPGALTITGIDDSERQLRAYLLHERRQLEKLEVKGSGADPAHLQEAARWLTWRTCMVLASLHPWWRTDATSLTGLATVPHLGLKHLVADPCGMYATLMQRIPGLQPHLPRILNAPRQTGVCFTPKTVPQAITALSGWPQTIPAHPPFEVTSAAEIRALREALLYAQRLGAGLWEVSDLVVPEEHRMPCILADQGDREEHPERYPATPTVQFAAQESSIEEMLAAMEVQPSTGEPADGTPQPLKLSDDEIARRLEATALVTDTPTHSDDDERPWWKKVLNK